MVLIVRMALLLIAMGVALTAVVIRGHVVSAIIDEQWDELDQKSHSSGMK